MKMKKVIAVLTAAVMSISILAGCSGKDASGGNDVSQSSNAASGEESGQSGQSSSAGVTLPLEETMEFTAFAIMNGEYSLSDNAAMQQAMEDANIHITFDSVLGADLTEKRNLLLASGNYPDMFFKAGFTLADVSKYGSQGIFIPLEDLIREYAPALTSVLDEMNGWDYLTSPDGHIYSLPEIGRQNGSMITYWINKKWMDNLGLKEPASYEELYDVLKAFKEQDANGNGDPDDEIPMTCTDVCVPELLLAYEDYSYDYTTKTAVIDGEYTYVPTSERWKDYITLITRLYQDGLLDKNAFTQSHEQQGAIGQSGDVLGSFFDAGAFLTVGRDNDDDYIALTPFYDGTYPLNTGITPGTMVITDACEHPEILIAWVDQLYTDEGGTLAWLGVEGKTWKTNDKGEWEWIVGQGYGDDITAVRSSNTIQGAANHPSIQPDFWFDNMSVDIDPDEVYLNGERAKVAAKGVVPLPMMNYSDEDNKEIATLKTEIDAYIQQYTAQVATGELVLEDSWDAYVETMNAMGAERLTEIYRAAYEEAVNR